MKIAIVHSFYRSINPSGENTAILNQVNALVKAGHEVKLISTNSDSYEKKSLNPILAGFTTASGVGKSPIRDLIDFAPDIVHTHNLFPNYGWRWLNNWEGPIVTTLHNYRPLCANGTFSRNGKTCTLCLEINSGQAIINACYRESKIYSVPLAIQNYKPATRSVQLKRPDKLIVLSERSRNYYSKIVDAERLHIVPNFIPPALVKSRESRQDFWLYIGRLSSEKGVKELINNWNHDAPLWIAGNGPLEESLKNEEHKNVRFLGSLKSIEIDNLLSRARGLVIPSLWSEGIPTVYLEALAHATPVLALAGNSAADDILKSHTGAVLQEANWRKGIEDIENNWNAFSKRSYERYLECFTEATWLGNIDEIYARLKHEWDFISKK